MKVKTAKICRKNRRRKNIENSRTEVLVEKKARAKCRLEVSTKRKEASWKAFNLGVLDDNVDINMILIVHWKCTVSTFRLCSHFTFACDCVRL